MTVYRRQDVVPATVRTFAEDALAEVGYFHVGGTYQPCHNEIVGDDLLMTGQMYVEAYIPKKILHPYPILMIHGNNQTGVGFMQTLEGKPGWVHDFLAAGYAVYVADQPERGRSVCTEANGPRHSWPANATARLFSAPGGYPGAEKHTQWPGAGVVGDEVYDAFFMTQVDAVVSMKRMQELIRAAGGALFAKIGPAVVLCHSQSGPFGWILGNDHPESVKGIISIEPSGPPFTNARTGEAQVDVNGHPISYGITQIPLDYDPPLNDLSEVTLARHEPDEPGQIPGWLPASPRRLPKLAKIPSLVLSAEASFHTPYDYLTAKYLRAAGVPAEYLRLDQLGVHGNGHMMMVEKNSDAVARCLIGWLDAHAL